MGIVLLKRGKSFVFVVFEPFLKNYKYKLKWPTRSRIKQ